MNDDRVDDDRLNDDRAGKPSDDPGDGDGDSGKENHGAERLDDFDPADAPSNPDLVGHSDDDPATRTSDK